MKTVDQLRKELSPARRRKIDARTAQLVAEELTLQELRKAHQKTQTQVAKELGMTQDQVSRLEQRSDVLLSTLRKYIEGIGGRLSLVAEFPNHEPVSLTGFGSFEAAPRAFAAHPKRHRAPGAKLPPTPSSVSTPKQSQ